MFNRRVTNDFQPRTRNGQPPHSTTGVASAACTHCDHDAGIPNGRGQRASSASMPAPMSNGSTIAPIVISTSGTASTSPSWKRRVIDRSSGLPSSAASGVSGSSAIPQIGQAPGAFARICGCIGHV